MPMRRICCARPQPVQRSRALSSSSLRSKRYSFRQSGGRSMLNGVFLIARREYLERVRSKVFRIVTLLVPLAMGALVAAGGVGGKRLEGVRRLAIASDNPVVAQGVKTFLETGEVAPQYVEVVAPATEADRTRLKQEVASHQLDGYLSIELGTRQADPEVT